MRNAYSLPVVRRFLAAMRACGWLLLLLAAPVVRAQAPAWQLAIGTTHAGGPNTSGVAAMTTDASGNVYLTGYFGGTVSFGDIVLSSVSLGPYDMFVAKWNTAAGRFAWVQQAGGAGYDIPAAIAVAGSSVYVGGIFSSGPVTFGSITVTGGNAFVAKLTDAGATASFTWVQQVGGVGTNGISALAATTTSVYAAGYFSSATATFGSTVLTNADASGYTVDAFVTRLTDAGSTSSFAWAQRAGGTGIDSPNALALNGSNVYVAGTFASPSISFGGTTLANAGAGSSADIFVAKLTETGTSASFTWVQRAGGLDSDGVNALVANGPSLYLAGAFAGTTAGFGSNTLTNSGTGAEVFVAKLTDAGNTSSFGWAQRAGGTGEDQALALAVNGPDVYVTGSYGSSAAGFGSTTLANSNPGRDDLFVAKLTDAGSTSSFAWAQRAGSARGRALAISGTTVYVAGVATPTASFGSQTITNAGGGQTAFLAALPTIAVLATATPSPLAGVVVAPNPAHGLAVVQLPVVAVPESAVLTLLDAVGRVVRVTAAAPAQQHSLDLQGLAPGVYLLRVQVGEDYAVRRLVVE
ncbi:T9SS type A sorting domain-containing protein [Hymenobacter ginkgonis]|nr:T9SS type A sorting domain-containing protein [Hymenobacter ginkgonis]